jgi:hypothetical protein
VLCLPGMLLFLVFLPIDAELPHRLHMNVIAANFCSLLVHIACNGIAVDVWTKRT